MLSLREERALEERLPALQGEYEGFIGPTRMDINFNLTNQHATEITNQIK